MPQKPDKSLFWMGKYLSLALTLPASILAGYFVAVFVQHWVHFSLLPLVGILLGMIAGLTKIIQEVSRDGK